MGSNIIVKALAGVFVVGLIFIIIGGKNDKGGELRQVESGPAGEFNGLGEGLMGEEEISAEYGVDVDSPVETMRTLTRETKIANENVDKAMKENDQLRNEIRRLMAMRDDLEGQISDQVRKSKAERDKERRELDADQSRLRALLNRLEGRVDSLKQHGTDTAAYDDDPSLQYNINESGIPTGLGYDMQGNQVNYNEVVWSSGVDASVGNTASSRPGSGSNLSLPKLTRPYNPVDDLSDRLTGSDSNKKARLIKAYTIPNNATLFGSVSMTALLGRIPIGGTVSDPYPFKIIVGEENLSSNGINIPNVSGITMSGVAKGDWTLSCVSGEIRSMTFTFNDGTVRTIPDPEKTATSTLAWFSDANGIPCVTGKRITNAPQYLSSRVLLSAAESYAKARADAEYTTDTSTGSGGTSTSKTLTGSATMAAQNTAIGEGLSEVTDWINQRQANSFDAIYVAPGTPIVIHTSEELQIDYDPEGRKVNHYAELEPRNRVYMD